MTPVMSRAATKKTGKGLQGTLERVRQGERVVLRHGRKAVAAVVPIEDLKRLQKIEDDEDLGKARAALKEARQKGTIPGRK